MKNLHHKAEKKSVEIRQALVQVVEQLAIDRAKELFGADYANVQPHSG